MPSQNKQQLLKLKVHPVILTLKLTSWWFVSGKMKETYIYNVENNLTLYICNYLSCGSCMCRFELNVGWDTWVRGKKVMQQNTYHCNPAYWVTTAPTLPHVTPDLSTKWLKNLSKTWPPTAVYSPFHLFLEWWSTSMSEISPGSGVSLPESWSSITEIPVSDLPGFLCNDHATVKHTTTFLSPTNCAWLLCSKWHSEQDQAPRARLSLRRTLRHRTSRRAPATLLHTTRQGLHLPCSSLKLNHHLVWFQKKKRYLQNYIGQDKLSVDITELKEAKGLIES